MMTDTKHRPYCKSNHPMSGRNLYISPDGRHHCRTCKVRRKKGQSTTGPALYPA